MRSEPKGGQTRQNGSQSKLDRCHCSRQTAGSFSFEAGQKIARQPSLAQAWRQGYAAGHAARNPTEPLGALNGCRLMVPQFIHSGKLDRVFFVESKGASVAAFFLEAGDQRTLREVFCRETHRYRIVAFLEDRPLRPS